MAGERARSRPSTSGAGAETAEGRVAVVRKIPCVVRGVTDHGEHVYTVELEPSMRGAARSSPGSSCTWRSIRTTGRLLAGVAGVLDRQLARRAGPARRSPTRSRARSRRAWSASWPSERSVWVKLPYGEFMVDPARDAVLFAGGTGVTAFTAFLRSLDARSRAARPALLRRPDAGPLRLRRRSSRRAPATVPSLTCSLVCEETHGRLRGRRRVAGDRGAATTRSST